MAITRTNDTDDDGTGTTGTVRNAAWKDEIYDQIDAAIDGADAAVRSVALGGTGRASATAYALIAGGTTGTGAHQSLAGVGSSGQVLTSNGAGALPTFQDAAAGGAWVEQTTTATGAQNNFDLTGGRMTVLRCTGAAPSFSGFTVEGGAPAAGDQVLILCLGTTAKVTNQDTNSTAANRIITPSTNGQIVGVNGMMLLVYDDTTDRWRETLLSPGAWISVAYSAGDYTGSGSMTWTVDSGDVSTFQYRQLGAMLELMINISTSTIGGTPSTGLRVALPGGFTAVTATFSYQFAYIFNNSANMAGYTLPGSTYLEIRRIDGANYTAETNAAYVATTASVAVN